MGPGRKMAFIEVRHSYEENSNGPYQKISGRLSHSSLSNIFQHVVIMYILLYKQLCKILKHLGIATVYNSHYQRYLPMRVTNAPGKVPTDQYHCRHNSRLPSFFFTTQHKASPQ